ncbi:MAG TPA: BadF/BadG/BcrA/BcrD ATPase family protein [Longimicrobiales bacterium]|nr:BadF/BadG/BcrA/BcrD ATPase family protein [Longimicrobiales bacterium]
MVGVDGGGTSTRATIVDARGLELGRAEAPGAVVTTRAPEAAAQAVAQAVRGAAERACVDLPAAMLWAGLSGAGHDRARLAVTGLLERAALAERVVVGTDVRAAFQAAFPEGPGILLIAGTGSIAWGRTPEGEIGRAGGWGQSLGDEGGGYAIGLGALRAVVRADDGREGATVMRDDVLRALALSEPAELVPWTAAASKAEIAGLVPIVVRAATNGDPAACHLIDEAVRELARHVTAMLERLGPWPSPPPLLLWGGLVGEDGPLRESLVRELSPLPVELRPGPIDPTLGAANLALEVLSRSSK